MKTRIIIDSTADIRSDLRDCFMIVPLTINFGDEEYIDGVTIDHKTFYEKLIESDVMPTTSQATPDSFIKVYDEVVNSGDNAVVITVASKLSGTYQSAVIASEDYADRIFVIDSKSVAIGTGILAEMALTMADNDIPASVIATPITS